MKFYEAYNKMPGLLKTLDSSEPVRSRRVWRKKKGDLPKKGIYVSYQKRKAMYVGRSNNLPAQITGHGTANGPNTEQLSPSSS